MSAERHATAFHIPNKSVTGVTSTDPTPEEGSTANCRACWILTNVSQDPAASIFRVYVAYSVRPVLTVTVVQARNVQTPEKPSISNIATQKKKSPNMLFASPYTHTHHITFRPAQSITIRLNKVETLCSCLVYSRNRTNEQTFAKQHRDQRTHREFVIFDSLTKSRSQWRKTGNEVSLQGREGKSLICSSSERHTHTGDTASPRARPVYGIQLIPDGLWNNNKIAYLK